MIGMSERAEKIIARMSKADGISSVVVDIDGETFSSGDCVMCEVIRSAVVTARVASQRFPLTRKVRVATATHTIVVDVHPDGALAIAVLLGDKAMKSVARAMRRAWEAGAATHT